MFQEVRELFVPGRLCLFGEHSDWAGGHRRQNSQIEIGYAIVAPTNQGNYARVHRLDKPVLIFRSVALGNRQFECPLDEKELLKIAELGGEFSYVAGVAHEILVNYNNHSAGLEINGYAHGLEIDNHKSDLPLKKGLSSSASICVLVAKAFKELYDLPLNTRGIMNVAYNGEITTPSRCGKLDQACAYPGPLLMTFDADRISIEELKPLKSFYLVIVDLNAKKDTQRILAELNKGFPFPANEHERRKHEYLGKINREIVRKAAELIRAGDSESLGKLMSEAQERFDEYLAPSCPEELTAPKLHKLLSYFPIQQYLCGGKGVGSQGDGCAQFVARNKESQKKLIDILNSDVELNVHALPLSLT